MHWLLELQREREWRTGDAFRHFRRNTAHPACCCTSRLCLRLMASAIWDPSAFSWVDRLHDAGQRWWQSLPLGPTGYGNSPYQPMSSFAGNALLISPESLISDGLLAEKDCESHFPSDVIDYDAVIRFKTRLLEIAWKHFKSGNRKDLRPEFDEFRNKQEHWLEDYALFRALKAKYDGAYYLDWPEEVVQRRPEALATARRELVDEIDQVRFAQFLLFRQGDQLKAYAHSKGVTLIGDLPFFVSPDSSDVWANPELFLLDEHRRPRFVAGVPPDYFSAQGQLWGNPVYDWDAFAQPATDGPSTGCVPCWLTWMRFGWTTSADLRPPGTCPRARQRPRRANGCRVRVRTFSKLYRRVGWPTVHRRRSGTYYSGCPRRCATNFNFREHVFCSLLSTVIPTIHTCHTTLSATLWSTPARMTMRQLENGTKNCLIISGRTSGITSSERRAGSADAAPALMDLAWSSKAALAIAPLQDVLNLGTESRMNVPGRADGNWGWRCREDMLSQSTFEWLRNLTETSKRAGAWASTSQGSLGNESMSVAVSGP